ncbi:MAG: Spy/CpxP family protein refolding chaperone [Planctomycetes bacterium]|nr:Spy/CpxP family protein refolding chaperone [Planctomycetota bacterium]MBL7039523.1 Spy/CpxP family protein refolding chaperone [Pirellulaceae bacterium]
MRRSLLLFAATGMVALCVGTVALAQPGGRGMRGGSRGGTNLLSLAQNEAVQKEIEVVDDQKAEIDKAAEEIRAGREGGQRPDFRNMSEAERDKLFAQMRERREKEAKAGNAKLEEILLPPQIKRLKEIALQQRGTSALTDPEVAKELKITDAQKKKLDEVSTANRESMGTRMRELFQGGNREGVREKMQEMRKEADGKVLGVLTAEQKKQFEGMKGEKFEMPERTRGGGRRGGGRGQGGQRPQRPASNT